MKIYNTQAEIDADIVDGVLKYNGDIQINFDCVINASIHVMDIDALNLNARNIHAENIDVLNIKVKDIKADNIYALDINAEDINANNIHANNIDADNIVALNIKANNIYAWDIEVKNIKALNINFYALCIAYENIKCKSYKARRENHIIKALDGEIIVENQEGLK